MKPQKKKRSVKEKIVFIIFCLLVLIAVPAFALAGGPFGAPAPLCQDDSGLHTSAGYWFGQTKYKKPSGVLMRQNQIYSEAGYAIKKYGDIYVRVGASDFKITDAFASLSAATVTNKNDFNDEANVFGTLGVKGFYPVNNVFGLGMFMQGTFYFGNVRDKVYGIETGEPFALELKLKNLWNISGGFGLQISAPLGIKLYAGTYGYYTEATVYPRVNIAGLPFSSGREKIKSKTNWGGYTGLYAPLGKGFGLNVEGQYSERLSAGVAVTYTY
ncbi:MAG TPA: hypothetical protein ENN23_08935 [Deltaproteobacteria bacterium]|nr:hypothetical protein [Deltaproteobacteria bacterium]